ncbi:hypothetical protein L1049_011795 [Liquidambar formosana]|uniref:RING-type E3 ubiquitin transferase n=1 Tax=Liquidambar formosana TaxID=63359 RepID=A0AAP0RRY0_LIQFO
MDGHASHLLGLSPFTVAIISIAAVASMLMIYHCIVAHWCSQRETIIHRRPQQPAISVIDIPSSLENSITELIPSYKYTKDISLVSKTEDATCAVCLCEFKDGEPVRVLPECLHAFHVPCIDMWLYSHLSCPLCRSDMTPPQNLTGRLPDTLRQPAGNQPWEAVRPNEPIF